METHDRHSKNHIFMMSSENIFEEKEVKTFASAKLQQKYVAGNTAEWIQNISLLGEGFYVDVLSN